MKKDFAKGHPLTEEQLKAVKGGAWYAIKVVTVLRPFPCDLCDNTIRKFIYNENTETYTAICDQCGCSKEVQIEE